jgi:hypothetical protein
LARYWYLVLHSLASERGEDRGDSWDLSAAGERYRLLLYLRQVGDGGAGWRGGGQVFHISSVVTRRDMKVKVWEQSQSARVMGGAVRIPWEEI